MARWARRCSRPRDDGRVFDFSMGSTFRAIGQSPTRNALVSEIRRDCKAFSHNGLSSTAGPRVRISFPPAESCANHRFLSGGAHVAHPLWRRLQPSPPPTCPSMYRRPAAPASARPSCSATCIGCDPSSSRRSSFLARTEDNLLRQMVYGTNDNSSANRTVRQRAAAKPTVKQHLAAIWERSERTYRPYARHSKRGF